MTIHDSHCHFFSTTFFGALGRQMKDGDPAAPHTSALTKLGWDSPGTAEELADRWAAELDRAHVQRAALIASVPGDSGSVAAAVKRHPRRFVGWFMVDPAQADAADTIVDAVDRGGLRVACLFPAMHRTGLKDERTRKVFELMAARPDTAVFVHCGVLKVGVRAKLGLPSRFDIGLGDPLQLVALAHDFPRTPIIIPHFGAGFFREALMAADACPNIHLDTSSSNKWIAYHPGLTLSDVFRQALAVTGPDRLLFGSDSSFFPRGWVRDVYEQQSRALDAIGVNADVRARIFSGNFERLFPIAAN
jgi:predicted TIM-barrel fold metal-dependent hydrolase